MAAKSRQNGPKTPSGPPKTPPRNTEEGPRPLQEAPKRAQQAGFLTASTFSIGSVRVAACINRWMFIGVIAQDLYVISDQFGSPLGLLGLGSRAGTGGHQDKKLCKKRKGLTFLRGFEGKT